jgi:hypothetical protein
LTPKAASFERKRSRRLHVVFLPRDHPDRQSRERRSRNHQPRPFPSYAAAAADEAREADAAEWAEALIADPADEPKRND